MKKTRLLENDNSYPGRREEPSITWFATMTTYFTFIVVIVMGHLRDFLGKVFRRSRYIDDVRSKPGYAPLFKSWENFYTRRLYHRIQVHGSSVCEQRVLRECVMPPGLFSAENMLRLV